MKWTSEDYRDKIVNIVEELRKYKTYIIIGLALIITGVIFIASKNNISKSIELIGPQTISMYQGDIYKELGFKAYDKDNNNYDDEVKIETNLNTEVPGTYEITYKIGKKEVTRTIIVLEKPIQYYEMMLEKINGEETIYLKVNEEYILPGYKILDQDGVDVTEIVEVVISGEVDITQAGRYILVYEFKNQNEEVITKTREVVVIDNKLEINMSKTTPTNQDITLEIKVEDEYFESLTLPSYEKIDVKEYTYIVDKNGKYKFILNNKHGFNIEKEIEITNIDKEVPTGNCIATRQNGKTIVTVSGNDNIGISKYIIDGVTYTNKDITVNKELQTVKIELLDDAGNKNNIECVAVNKNLSISATPSITSYTNSNVKITVKVESEYFDYIKLPNGTIINNKNYTYEVSTNGTYTFIAYNKDGQSKSVSAVINNIDKQNPTGSCSGSYKDGVSNVIISASDNIGISKYVIDGVTYTSKDIKINKEITNLNVMIYDKANNTYQATCTLQNLKPTIQDDPIYQTEKYHNNTINGIRYRIYNQMDSRWKDLTYYNGATMGSAGCHNVSVAVIVSAHDYNITPKEVFKNSSTLDMSKMVHNLAPGSFECKSVTKSAETIVNALAKGDVVIVKVFGRNKGGSNPFTSSQHYMALIDYSDNKIFVGNAYSSSGKGLSGWYSKDDVLKSVQSADACTPTQALLDKNH